MPCWFKISRVKRFKFKKACKNFLDSLLGFDYNWKKSFFHSYRDDDTIWTKSFSVHEVFQQSFSVEEDEIYDESFNTEDEESEYSYDSNGEGIIIRKQQQQQKNRKHICQNN